MRWYKYKFIVSAIITLSRIQSSTFELRLLKELKTFLTQLILSKILHAPTANRCT